jgi:phosphohistidine phosphatase
MQLYLLRHANADTTAETDDQRFLSEKGMQQASRVARFCDAHEIRPGKILTSPIRRAHQTAAEVSGHLKSELITARWLACGATATGIMERLDEYKSEPSLMLVGHEPDLSNFIGFLIGSKVYGSVHVRKSTLVLVDLPDLVSGCGRLEFSIPVRMM